MGHRLASAALVLATLAPGSALALRPDATKVNRPPDLGSADLARVADPDRQAALTAGKTWSNFLTTHGAAWRVTWDDRAGTPRQIVGGSIPLVPVSANSARVEAASRAFLNTVQALSGVNDSLLRTAILQQRGHVWFVRFDRVTAAGEPIVGAYAELRIVKGKIVLIRLETHPVADLSIAKAKLTATEATSKAHAALAAYESASNLRGYSARQVIFPVATGDRWSYRPAFQIETAAVKGIGRWKSTVDAITGAVLARESLIRYAVEGTVYGAVELRTYGDVLTPVALPFITVNPGSSFDTDATGFYNATNAVAPASVFVSLTGPYIDVNNEAGADSSTTFNATTASGNTFTWTATTEHMQAEIDAFRSASVVRNWALGVIPTHPWLAQRLGVNVNINDECNAYWDGNSINFFDEGSDCNNTARISDIVYHEFGHGLHQNVGVSGTIDGAVGEGSGDFLAATITGSSSLGPGFMKNGGSVRELEPNHAYPDDLTGEVHEDGLIWAGAMWDLRKALIAKKGETDGRNTIDAIFVKVLTTGPVLDQVYDEVLFADDDDADLSNGTPNECEINAAFGLHGLTGASGAFSLRHAEITVATVGAPTKITATKPVTTGACTGAQITTARLKYKVNGGTAQSVNLVVSEAGDSFSGEIPALEEGSSVRYWIIATLEDASAVTTPAKAPENSFGFYVGPLFTVWSDDFESEQTWTHGGNGDDWEIGTPNGQGNDPADAYSGTKVLGNNLGGNGMYESMASNWMESPQINCKGCQGTRLQFRRWLTIEDATFDRARILINDEEVYANPIGAGMGGALPRDPMWSFQDIDISEFADGHNFTIRFELNSDEGVEYGGWTVDNLSVVTPSEPGNGGGGGGGLFGCGCTITPTPAPIRSLFVPALLAVGLMLPILRRRRSHV